MSRIAPRKSLKTQVYFLNERGKEFLYFISENISTSGLLIQSPMPMQAGTKVFLKFCLFEGDEPIEVAAQAMRFHDKKRGPGRHRRVQTGIGLRFLGLEPQDFKRIESFIAS